MTTRTNTALCGLAFCFCLILPSASRAVSLQVKNTTAHPGDSITVRISVDQPAEIAAAIFALSYNTDHFLLSSVDSSFFGTFAEQWQSMNPVPDPLPPAEVQVDGVTYTSPVVYKLFDGRVQLAGTRVQAGQTATALFDLHFTVAENVPDGIYPLFIAPISMNNESCGYSTGSEPLPLLTGEEEAILQVSLTSGTILVQNSAGPDTDQDGIDDLWEKQVFGDLTTAGASTDYDHDGYTDLQEYLNQFAGETDPAGNPFNPKEENAPGGMGYKKIVITPVLWLLLGK
ncbi:MAG: cohesin domain-containing protein [Candidatus Electrothrix aestuarii]|uniref:Cohesin domain-containing protein n=1 Tax=Candidatus Electrothrix aestuarii TaxID=3062594 RepID=A0AAU8LQ47_9BACT|nr:cohesin domain-containing protein [Candidatus Electrothrix aestuarii]